MYLIQHINIVIVILIYQTYLIQNVLDYQKVMTGRRVSINREMAKVFNLKIGDWVVVKNYKDKAIVIYPAKPPQVEKEITV